jgi:hypothetical protein
VKPVFFYLLSLPFNQRQGGGQGMVGWRSLIPLFSPCVSFYFYDVLRSNDLIISDIALTTAHERADNVSERLAQPNSGHTGLGFRPLDSRVSASNNKC